MGLDMYLNARLYTSEYSGDKESFRTLAATSDAVGLPSGGNFRSITIETVAASWRKDNQIHKWFVDHCQQGVDNCAYYAVGGEQLIELRHLCADLLTRRDAKEAGERLPPQSGFFFGSTDIDDSYWEGLKDTIEQLTALIDSPKFSELEFTYHSSW